MSDGNNFDFKGLSDDAELEALLESVRRDIGRGLAGAQAEGRPGPSEGGGCAGGKRARPEGAERGVPRPERAQARPGPADKPAAPAGRAPRPGRRQRRAASRPGRRGDARASAPANRERPMPPRARAHQGRAPRGGAARAQEPLRPRLRHIRHSPAAGARRRLRRAVVLSRRL